MKKHGFDASYLYVWLISIDVRTIHTGLCPLVDRKDRRNLSVFQIGLRVIQRRLVNTLSMARFSFLNQRKLAF